MVNTDLGDQSFDASEVRYYRRDYVDVADAPLLRCYDALYSEELRRYHILLDDVSETHITASEKEPSLDMGWRLPRASLLCMPAGGVDNGLLKQERPCTAPATFGVSSQSPNQGLITSLGAFRLS